MGSIKNASLDSLLRGSEIPNYGMYFNIYVTLSVSDFLNAMQIYNILFYRASILQTFLEITRQTPEKDFTNERRRVTLHVHTVQRYNNSTRMQNKQLLFSLFGKNSFTVLFIVRFNDNIY